MSSYPAEPLSRRRVLSYLAAGAACPVCAGLAGRAFGAEEKAAHGADKAAAGTTEVSSNIGGVTQAASDTGTAANDVLNSAAELAKQSEALRAEVDSFLSGVKAA